MVIACFDSVLFGYMYGVSVFVLVLTSAAVCLVSMRFPALLDLASAFVGRTWFRKTLIVYLDIESVHEFIIPYAFT